MLGFAGITCGPPATSIRRKEPADRGHQDEGNQRERHPPGRPSRPGGAASRVDGHLAAAGSSGEPAELGTGRAAGVRCSRHSEYPRPIRAMPVGMANSR